ncbi:MAG: PQQ-binding-like beta-propeller repeat protein [Anaerolineae bacterium]
MKLEKRWSNNESIKNQQLKSPILCSFACISIVLVGIALNLFNFYASFSPRLPDFSGNRTIISNSLPIQEKWRHKMDGAVRYVIARDQQLWVWHGDWVSAVDIETGQELWHAPAHLTVISPPAAGDNAIAFEQENGAAGNLLKILDASSGQLKWQMPVDMTYSLAVANGLVYVGTARLDAYDLGSGKMI